MGLQNQVNKVESAGRNMSGMDGGPIEAVGILKDVPIQIGSIKTVIPVLFTVSRRSKFFLLGGDVFSARHIARIHTHEIEKISVLKFRDETTMIKFRSGDGLPPE